MTVYEDYLSKKDYVEKASRLDFQKPEWFREFRPNLVPLELGLGVKIIILKEHIFGVLKKMNTECEYFIHHAAFDDAYKYDDISNYEWTLWLLGPYGKYEFENCSFTTYGPFFAVPFIVEMLYRFYSPNGQALVFPDNYSHLSQGNVSNVIHKTKPIYVDNDKIIFYLTRDIKYIIHSGLLYEIVPTAVHKSSIGLSEEEILNIPVTRRVMLRPFTISSLAYIHDTPRDYMDYHENALPQIGI